MQKQVSKQSLAIVALSILLAIAMALTATFAAFSNDKAISGTVTFSGNVITTMTLADTYAGTGKAVTAFTAGTKTSVGTMTFANVTNATEAAALVTALENITVGLDSASSSASFAVKATSSAAFLTITPKDEVAESWSVMTQGFKASLAAGNNVTLGDLYDIVFTIGNVPSNAVTSSATIQVVIYADTVAANVDEASVTLA
jgi:hypothetical protein